MINTTDELGLFWRFSITAGFLPSDSLATDHCSFTPRRHPPHQQDQVVRRPFPAGYCLTPTDALAKTERGPISMSDPSTLSMSPNQATLAEKSIRCSSLTAAQPLNILSRPATINASGSRRACRMAISRNARSLPDFPEFAQAVRGMVSPELRAGMVSPELQATRRALPDAPLRSPGRGLRGAPHPLRRAPPLAPLTTLA